MALEGRNQRNADRYGLHTRTHRECHSGNCLGEKGIPQPITGEVKEGKIIFHHGGDYQGQELTIIYTATLPKPGEMKGTIIVKPFEAEGTFTAVPEPQKKSSG